MTILNKALANNPQNSPKVSAIIRVFQDERHFQKYIYLQAPLILHFADIGSKLLVLVFRSLSVVPYL